MSFFRQFPLAEYDLRKTGTLNRITDLFRNVTSPQIKLDPSISYINYQIQNGDRPDIVSEKLYGDPDYYWTFFIINDHLKYGHVTWPKSQYQMERYLTQEYDGYSVIQMADDPQDHYTTYDRLVTADSMDFSVDSESITADIVSEKIEVSTSIVDRNNSIIFTGSHYVYNRWNDTVRKVMKYDPYMQQLWIKNEGASDEFLSILEQKAFSVFELTSSLNRPISPAIVTHNKGSTKKIFDRFIPITDDISGKIQYGLNAFASQGRNAIHHFIFSPQVGDYVQFESTFKANELCDGIKGMVTAMIEPYGTAYGGITVDNKRHFYFTEPEGFLVTMNDVMTTLYSPDVAGGNTEVCHDIIAPLNRIRPVTYAEYENQLNETRSSIRVINPTHIRAFVKQYRNLINA